MRIDYHKWRAFKDCPKKFHLQHIKKEPVTVPTNDYFKLYGVLTQRFFQMYCNIWRFKTPYLFPEIIRERLEKLYRGVLLASTVDWDAKGVKLTEEEVLEQSYASICAIMESQNQNYFLNTKSEITIEIKTRNNDVINGRIDFIHHPPTSKDIIIIDGKGTETLGKNIDKNQLFFYALLCYFKYNIIPAQMGFFYYKFNTFAPIPIDVNSLNKFRAELSLGIKSMTEGKNYPATPGTKACRYCLYKDKCSEATKIKKKATSKLELDGDGLVSFGF